MTKTTSDNLQENETVIETFKDIIPLSFKEEVGNSVLHGLAAMATLLILPYAAVHAYFNEGQLFSISVSIYVISIFLMFISSTVYHSMKNNTSHKYILRIIDHSMIYVAISGTYTPVLLHVVGGWIGWLVCLLLWATTIWGILYKSLSIRVNHKLSLLIYLLMGWIGIIFLPIIFIKTSLLFILFIFLGGIAYTIGAWFYAQKNRPYFHMIWHIFIVIASLFHLIAILYFI